jgi:hypothetical protein
MASKKTSAKKIVLSTGAPASARVRVARPRSAKPAETPSLAGSKAAVARETTRDSAPSQDEIASLAYLYWEARGCQGGSPEEDWIRAERELRARSSAALA